MKDIQRLKELYTQYKEKKCTAAEIDLFFDLLSRACFNDSVQNGFSAGQLQVSTVAGESKEFSLSDGTVVKLGGESSLIYSELFRGNQRYVRLQGQALFEVTSSADYPFVISSGIVTTKTNESCLNILSFEDCKQTEVCVLKGKAMVSIETETFTRKWRVRSGKAIVVDHHVHHHEQPKE